MGHADYLSNGNYNAICDRCGSKFKFSMLKKEWDGLYVCTANGCWEARQPQDYVKGIRDNMSVPVSRPEAGNMFMQALSAVISSTATLIVSRIRLQSYLVNVISASSISKVLFKPTKVINGSTINSNTIG
jgi:hypothetical protein